MKRPSAPVYLVRHGPVFAKGICYGQFDVNAALSPEEAARTLAPQVTALGLVAIHTSPWQRTEPVARALAAACALPVVVDARLSELSMGEWEGRPFADLEANDLRFAQWMAVWQTAAPPGGERVADLLHRVRAWLEEPRGGPCLAVTHAGVIRAARALRRGVSYADVVAEPVEHLSVELMA